MSDTPTVLKPKFYGLPELHALGIRYTNPGLKNLENTGQFPQRIHLSVQRIVWEASAVDEWIVSRLKNPDALKSKATGRHKKTSLTP